MLPGVGGEAVLSAIRDRGDTPVLIASAKRSDEERIAGLRMGADDYLAKPYNPHELTARVAAVLRRSRGQRGRAVGRARSGRTARTSTRTRSRSMAGAWSWIPPAAASRSRGARTRADAAIERPADARRARPAGGPRAPARRGPDPRPAARLGHPPTGRGLRSGRGRPRRQPASQARRRRRRSVAHRDDPADRLPADRVAGPA